MPAAMPPASPPNFRTTFTAHGETHEVITLYSEHSNESWDHMHPDRRSWWNHRIGDIHAVACDRALGIEAVVPGDAP